MRSLVIFLTFLTALICAGCSSTHENCAVFSQFAYEADFGSEESVPDTTVFPSLNLGPEWLLPNGPVSGMAYVDERPETIVHGIALPCAKVSSRQGEEIPCYVARRIRSEQFAVMVEMFFEPHEGDAAGLLVSKVASSERLVSNEDSASLSVLERASSQYFFCRISTGLALRRINDKGVDLLAETELPDFVTRVYLRIERNGNLFSFFYRYEGSGPDDWTQVADGIDISFDSTGNDDAILVGLCAEQEL